MTPTRAMGTLLLLVAAEFASAGIPQNSFAAESGAMGAIAPQIEARLPQWVAAWKAASPTFDLRRFRLAQLKAVQEVWAPEAYDPAERHEELRRKLYVMSPDGTRAIYPYAMLFFLTREGRTTAGIGTDSGAMLIDFASKRTMWLGECNLACGFHDAAWLGNDRAVVVGYTIDFDDTNCPSDRRCTVTPDLMVYDFSRRSVLLFKGPGVPAGPRRDYAVQRILERLPSVSFTAY